MNSYGGICLILGQNVSMQEHCQLGDLFGILAEIDGN